MLLLANVPKRGKIFLEGEKVYLNNQLRLSDSPGHNNLIYATSISNLFIKYNPKSIYLPENCHFRLIAKREEKL
ncbi:MAG: hypothetical protein EA409_02850 [Saprospirales bacterium]|nr:MAG: hypothetical protein EA409_02850 [Saprospirales bacterium]